ncbi:hypothetical protein BDY19DRAFT_903330 [Irpex rosettiformis]|uniref:Uncharacterized protein n=1 Tax=Irpex rosettiformis TaxID=378272 RepID=A0ACB8UDU3_9APHY|nr:hypothetical protein BDY19DRAFT_903330 [Irpex rosettiformis]
MAKSRNGPTSRRQMTQALPPAIELDVPRVIPLGRGQRELQPTERSLPFRQSIEKQNARLNAHRNRRLARLTPVAHQDAFNLEEEREMEEDPCAEDNSDSELTEDKLPDEDDGHRTFDERNISIPIRSEPHTQAGTASRPTKKLVCRTALSRIALPIAASQPATQAMKASYSKDHMNTVGNRHALPIEISDDDDDNTSETLAKRSKPKAGDYVGSHRAHLLRACSLFRVAISTRSAFPDGVELDQLAYDSFISADETEFGAQSEPNDNELKVIKARASQLRGQLVTNAKSLIKHTYGFASSIDGKGQEATIEVNRIKYDCYIDRAAFSYEVPGVRTPGTMFRNPIFLEVAQKTWFRHRRDEGVMFHDNFDSGSGFPLPALALIIVAVKNGLDEWKTDIHSPLDFTEKGYADEYLAILNTLRDWRDLTDQSGSQTAAKFQSEFLRRCRASVGICENVTVVPTNLQLTRADLLADEVVPTPAAAE